MSIQNEVVAKLCNNFLSIPDTDSVSIYLNENKAKEGMVCIDIDSEVAIVKVPSFDKLKYIFEKLGIEQVEKEENIFPRLYVPQTEIIKLSPFCSYKYWSEHNPPSNDDLRLQKIKILCAHYLGHTWEVRQDKLIIHSQEELNQKEQVVKDLYYANNIAEAKKILADNHKILNKNRTPLSILILKTIAIILTFPISIR